VGSKGESDQDPDKGCHEECIIRILRNEGTSVFSPRRSANKTLKEASKMLKNEEDDSEAYLDPNSSSFVSDYGRSWKELFRFPVSQMLIKGSSNERVTVQITLGNRTAQTRDFVFSSSVQADDFQRIVKLNMDKEAERADSKFHSSTGTETVKDEELLFLIEIVSARDLLVGDRTSSDPYVKCMFDGGVVHQTKYIPKKLDPIWTVKTGSLFLFSVNSSALFKSNGLLCKVIDFDQVSDHESLGSAIIRPLTLYKANGERLEFELEPPSNIARENMSGFLVIRCRRASKFDVDFIKEHTQVDGPTDWLGVNYAMMGQGGGGNLKSLITKNTRVVKDKNFPDGIKQVSRQLYYI
jgi:hypothetical protein